MCWGFVNAHVSHPCGGGGASEELLGQLLPNAISAWQGVHAEVLGPMVAAAETTPAASWVSEASCLATIRSFFAGACSSADCCWCWIEAVKGFVPGFEPLYVFSMPSLVRVLRPCGSSPGCWIPRLLVVGLHIHLQMLELHRKPLDINPCVLRSRCSHIARVAMVHADVAQPLVEVAATRAEVLDIAFRGNTPWEQAIVLLILQYARQT